MTELPAGGDQLDAEEAEAVAEYRAAKQAGTLVTIPQDEARRLLGLDT